MLGIWGVGVSRRVIAAFFLFFCVGEAVSAQVKSSEFMEGLSYELDGRATMLSIAVRMAKRFEGEDKYIYWRSYQRLEEFSRPRYEGVAKRLGVGLPNETWVSVKAVFFSGLPNFLISIVISSLHERTVIYVEKLRRLGQIGPAEEKEFYGYMVRQELLQVQLIECALREDYLGAETIVAEFIAKESKEGACSFGGC